MTKEELYKYLLEQMKDVEAGVYQVNVFHDDWCDFLNHRGECNCTPDIVTPRNKH